MKTLNCLILDPNNFTSVLLEEFVDKTPMLEIANSEKKRENPHLVFVDSEFYDQGLSKKFKSDSIVVISSDENKVHSYFNGDILDFVKKEELSYSRFLDAIHKYKARHKK